MSSTGQGRLLRSGMVGLQALRTPIRQETVNGSGLAEAFDDFWWGGYPPTPTQIPYAWLRPPARWRPAQPSNIAVVTRTGGEQGRSVNRTSIAALGERSYTATINTTVADDPVNLATYITTYYTAPRQRMPGIALQLVGRSPTECWRILSRKIGDRISIVGAPPASLPLAADTFSRTATSDWTTADTGQAYTVSPASDHSVNGAAGQQSHGSVNAFRSALVDVGEIDQQIEVDVSLPIDSAATASVTQWVCGRVADLSNYYAARLDLSTAGTVTLTLFRRAGGTLSGALATGVAVGTGHTSGDRWRVALEVVGTTLRAKAWLPSQAEPDWQTTVTDEILTSGTSVALLSRLEAGNTNTLPVVASWDNLTVGTPNAHAWPAGVTELVIEGIEHTYDTDGGRLVAWKTAPVIGSTPGVAGPWFRLGESRTAAGTDLMPF